jgi:hypothetical protein
MPMPPKTGEEMTLELTLQELIEMAVKKAQSQAWDAGWMAHAREWQIQKQEPSHPITRDNPFD